MHPTTAAIPHIGRKIERIRTIKGIKQSELAEKIGMQQGTLSKIEQSEKVESEKLKQIAEALEMTEDAIANFNEDAVISTINSFHDSSAFNFQCQFNPIDKIVELYERLLKSEREKNEIWELLQKEKEKK
jgi:transcriptional regulator with XRE-family HTH domain